MIRRIRLGFVVLACVVLQTTLFTHLRIDDVAPQIGLVAVLAVAYENGADTGALFGFVMGLSIDLFLTTPLGRSGVAARGHRVRGRGVPGRRGADHPVVGADPGRRRRPFGGLVFLTVGAVVGQPGFLSFESLKTVLISAMLDAVIAPLVFPIVRRAARREDTGATWRVRG